MKYISQVPLPTEQERELLTILMEECCEVAFRASKLIRFGATECQPGQSLSNATRLANEIGDVIAVARRLADLGVLASEDVMSGIDHKKSQLKTFLQTEAP